MKFHLSTDVISAQGTQVWSVEAETPEEAIIKYNKGEYEFVAEEIQVTHCGEPFNVKPAE